MALEKDDNSTDQVIVQRLNTIIALLLDRPASSSSSTTADKIYKLSDMGLRPAEIGRILSKPSKDITSALHKRNSRKRKK